MEALAAALAWRLFAALPVVAASGLGGWIARTVGPHLKPSRIARNNLRRAFPDMSASEIDHVVGEVWDNLGRNVGEFPHLKTIAAERIEIVGGEHIAALGRDGVPGILVGAHFGGWELSGLLAERLGVPVHVVYRAPNNPQIDSLFRKARGNAAERFIPKGAQGARRLVAVMRQGGHLGVLVDQKMNDGIAVDFMGRPAMTAPAVAHLALGFRCPVVPGRIERLPGARFRAIVDPPLILPDSGDKRRDTLELMERINRTIEGWVRDKPGQWLWLHRRWPD
ncbi:Lauroyl/myristoyl acyltransferase [uncultured Alphaproteobacteria bacterium]|uniref:Lauroyl/myristoyl acyltransferase n=1 Tax=uncultured Alphaproteobacteria bacterium TaxID=91750 RepID=A0A212JMF9_9PROT|nr:Lauroyl/myristoyl acyltransferase [uncultured Alphaproteobacteria bacterium]